MRKFLDAIKKHRYLILALAGISIVLAMPVPAILIEIPPNPDSAYDQKIYTEHNALLTIPPHATNISTLSIWMNDSVRPPKNAVLYFTIDNAQRIAKPLSQILSPDNVIRLPFSLPPSQSTTRITISSDNIPEAKALSVYADQHDRAQIAYIAYTKTPLIKEALHAMYLQDETASDIQYVWAEGAAITQGKNPYRKAESTSYNSEKYATYFPLSYLASAAIQRIGFTSFQAWLSVVRPIVFAFHAVTALAIFIFLYQKNALILGLFGFFFVLFDRWSLYVDRVAHIDFIAMAFLVLGLMLLKKIPKTAYVLIGISLSIKQMAIFIIPLILIWVWLRHRSIRSTGIALVLIFIVPIFCFIPFLTTSPVGVAQSILFSATRTATGDFSSPGISTLVHLEGSAARIAMAALMLLVYIAAYQKKIGLFTSMLCIFVIFIGFNPVIYYQYLAWAIPFIPLAAWESGNDKRLA